MINPIVIIVSAALVLSVIVVSIINKPKKPLVTGTIITVLVCFVVFTYMIDSAIVSLGTGDNDNFIKFLTMSDVLSYDGLSESFVTFMVIDIGLIAASLLSLFMEIMLILRKGGDKK